MAQEKGLVNENAEAVLAVEFSDSARIDCVLDTGFNGFLMLPRPFVEENSMDIVGREPVAMVEGRSAEIDIAVSAIKRLGERIAVNILVSETSEALIGTKLLENSILEIDYINSVVKVTKPR